MDKIIIDEEFKLLLPALDKTTYAWLEENILQYGCREPLVLWNGVLIDGHNRYEICAKHEIPFNTVDMEFDSRDAVLIWIISTQVARRNLTPMQMSFYRGLHYITDKKIITNESGRNRFSDVIRHNDGQLKKFSTASRLAEEYNVSPRTIERDAQVAEGINVIGITSPEARRDILAGKVRISKKKLCELSAGSEEDVMEAAVKIEEGTFRKEKPAISEAHPVEKEFKKITDAFYSVLKTVARDGDIDELRTVFRSYIGSVEEMLSQI